MTRRTRLRATIKYIIITAAIALIAAIAFYLYQHWQVEPQQRQLATRLERIRTMVQHNSLQLEDETVYRDTIAGICEVYALRARVTIGYDLEQMQTRMDGDTLIVQLPREVITTHETGRRLLDEYYADQRMHFSSPHLSPDQLRTLEERMRQRVTAQLASNDNIRQARDNELRNLAALLHTIHGNVRVVANLTRPDKEYQPQSPASLDELPHPILRSDN